MCFPVARARGGNDIQGTLKVYGTCTILSYTPMFTIILIASDGTVSTDTHVAYASVDHYVFQYLQYLQDGTHTSILIIPEHKD